MEGSSAPRELVEVSRVAAAQVFSEPAKASAVAQQQSATQAVALQGAATFNDGVLNGAYFNFGKRLFDIGFSLVFLLVLGFWLLPLLALLIKLDTPGPALFRQKRVGKGGRLFTCLKFRTMAHNPKARFEQARKGDTRITRVGRVLRKTNLDELPQFLNVLLGDMSVVGPRPHVAELDALFGSLVPGYTQRNSIRPGVTGLAQVSGCRGETRSVREMTHRIRFDLFYGRNIGLLLDMKIIVATVWYALAGDRKAY